MSLLLFFGFYGLSFFAFTELQKAWSDFWKDKRNYLNSNSQLENQFVALFGRQILWVLSFANWNQSLKEILRQWKGQPQFSRCHWLRLALSPFSLWLLAILVFGFVNWNFYYFLGLACGLYLFNAIFDQKILFRISFEFVFFVGLFGLGLDLMMKNAMLFQAWSFENEIAFTLADGTLGNLVIMLVCGMVLGFVFKGRMVSVPMILPLMMVNQLAMNVAVALLLGDLVGGWIEVFFNHRKSSNLKDFKIWLGASVGSALLGFFIFGYGKESLEVMSEWVVAYLQPMSFILLGGLALCLLPVLISGSVLGHFLSKPSGRKG